MDERYRLAVRRCRVAGLRGMEQRAARQVERESAGREAAEVLRGSEARIMMTHGPAPTPPAAACTVMPARAQGGGDGAGERKASTVGIMIR